MSETALVIAAGPADRNSGRPRHITCLGQLIVGGSGVWLFHDTSPRDFIDNGAHLRLRSERSLALEIAAGIALSQDFPRARAQLTRHLGTDWATAIETDLELTDEALANIAAGGHDLAIAVQLTATDALGDEAFAALANKLPNWSLMTFTTDQDRTVSQWTA